MKLPDTAHTSRPWRIHELTPDFRLEDVWALPVDAGPDDLPELVETLADVLRTGGSSPAVRSLVAIRLKLGTLLGLDADDTGVGARVPTLRDRLPADLRDAPSGPTPPGVPFSALYLTDDEWAAEIANRTMHGVVHLGLVPDESGAIRAQMAVLVKPNGLIGQAYMALIKPFRYLLVYPALLRGLGRAWQARPARPNLHS